MLSQVSVKSESSMQVRPPMVAALDHPLTLSVAKVKAEQSE